MPGLVQLITTLPSRDAALGLARAAVGSRAAACVQLLGPITSVYRWKGAVEEAEEFLCIMKCPPERLDRLVAFVRERHPYDTPEITTVDGPFVDRAYAAWAAEVTASPAPGGPRASDGPACR